MKRNFNDIIRNLKETIADYEYYVNFDKIYKNIMKYQVELNILNSLIGSKHIETDFLNILNNYPNVLLLIPLLLAIRNYEISIIDEKLIKYNFKTRNMSDEEYLEFMRRTKLFDLFENTKIKNLSDYITGIEVGLDTNARKNRTGKTMENIVEKYIQKINNIEEYHREMTKKEIYNNYNVNIDELLAVHNPDLKEAEKRFDFVVKTKKKLYLIETNFYNSSGSKLNETARSFKALSKSISSLENVSFIWITDGYGWLAAKNNLKEAYDVIEHFYTLYDLEQNILEKVIK